jgi:hypothetical protein
MVDMFTRQVESSNIKDATPKRQGETFTLEPFV